MAKYGVIKNGFIEIGNTDLSNHCTGFTPVYGNAALPNHAMSEDQEYSTPGLRTRSLTATFLNDFAAGNVFAVLNPLKNGAVHVIQYRHDAGTASALNPTYSGLWFITNVTGLIGGAKGSSSLVTVTWAPAGTEAELTT